jgi:hypothetical protein
VNGINLGYLQKIGRRQTFAAQKTGASTMFQASMDLWRLQDFFKDGRRHDRLLYE